MAAIMKKLLVFALLSATPTFASTSDLGLALGKTLSCAGVTRKASASDVLSEAPESEVKAMEARLQKDNPGAKLSSVFYWSPLITVKDSTGSHKYGPCKYLVSAIELGGKPRLLIEHSSSEPLLTVEQKGEGSEDVEVPVTPSFSMNGSNSLQGALNVTLIDPDSENEGFYLTDMDQVDIDCSLK